MAQNQTPVTGSSRNFPPLDKSMVRGKTNLDRNARKDGINEVPKSESNRESNTEQSIRGLCLECQSQYRTTLYQQRDAYQRRHEEILQRWSKGPLSDIPPKLVETFRLNCENLRDGLSQTSDNLRQSADQLLKFRGEHDLSRRRPNCKDIWTALNILLCFFAAELLITFFLLQESGGIAMVLIVSILYCFINCIFPFVVGTPVKGVQYKWEGKHKAKIVFAYLCGLVLIFVGLFINLLMGHYRSAALELANRDRFSTDLDALQSLVHQVNNIGVEAWANLFNNPLGIADTLSWMLVLAGLIAFVLSLWDGIFWNDSYPRYGGMSKEYHRQRKAYDTIRKSLLVRIDALH
ncbi:MAG: hypothetical protein OXG24_00480 [Gammaproteobacteria bacterium]|nr:hypothetical protein [Gammaproteobacteria bacterium]